MTATMSWELDREHEEVPSRAASGRKWRPR